MPGASPARSVSTLATRASVTRKTRLPAMLAGRMPNESGMKHEGWGDQWRAPTAAGSREPWVVRPQPPLPPPPRWRRSQQNGGDLSGSTKVVATAVKSRPSGKREQPATSTAAHDAGHSLMVTGPEEQPLARPKHAGTVNASSVLVRRNPSQARMPRGWWRVSLKWTGARWRGTHRASQYW